MAQQRPSPCDPALTSPSTTHPSLLRRFTVSDQLSDLTDDELLLLETEVLSNFPHQLSAQAAVSCITMLAMRIGKMFEQEEVDGFVEEEEVAAGPSARPAIGPSIGPSLGPSIPSMSTAKIGPSVGPAPRPTIGPAVGPAPRPAAIGPPRPPRTEEEQPDTEQRPAKRPKAGPASGPALPPTDQSVK